MHKRLTAGELLRRNLKRLVAMLARIDGVGDIVLATNGRCSPARPGCWQPCDPGTARGVIRY